MYKRNVYNVLRGRLEEPRRFMQVLLGPRQVGKTTITQQIIEDCSFPTHYASADSPGLNDSVWLEQQWEIGRLTLQEAVGKPALLILDEVHKIQGWSNIVKACWDADTRAKRPLLVVMLGSAPLLMQQGLTESLAGRFELIPVQHWSLGEMEEAFGWTVEQYIYFGGYPGAASLIGDELRWRQYINDSLIETTLSRDLLLMTHIKKPALLRRLFLLGCQYSGQILSFQKMLGQLQDAGNTTTLAHYLELLSEIGMLTGLSKFSPAAVHQRASSPKLQVFNTALITAVNNKDALQVQQDRTFWGRLVESAVGAHLVNACVGTSINLYYWREGNLEVDFVLQQGDAYVAIEVKSGLSKTSLPGMKAFEAHYPKAKKLLVGGDGLPLETFFKTSVHALF